MRRSTVTAPPRSVPDEAQRLGGTAGDRLLHTLELIVGDVGSEQHQVAFVIDFEDVGASDSQMPRQVHLVKSTT